MLRRLPVEQGVGDRAGPVEQLGVEDLLEQAEPVSQQFPASVGVDGDCHGTRLLEFDHLSGARLLVHLQPIQIDSSGDGSVLRISAIPRQLVLAGW